MRAAAFWTCIHVYHLLTRRRLAAALAKSRHPPSLLRLLNWFVLALMRLQYSRAFCFLLGVFFSLKLSNSLSSFIRLPCASSELHLYRHLGAGAGLRSSLVHATPAEAEQPQWDVGKRLWGQHDQQRARAAQPDQEPYRKARGPDGGHQRLRKQELHHCQNKDKSSGRGWGRQGEALTEEPLCQTASIHTGGEGREGAHLQPQFHIQAS